MFDLGMQELIVIFVVALLVFGPKKLPELARSLGKGIAQLKKSMTDIKSEVDKEIREANEQVKHEVPAWKDVVDVEKIKDDLKSSLSESRPGTGEDVYGVQDEKKPAEEEEKKGDEPEGDDISEGDSDTKRGADG